MPDAPLELLIEPERAARFWANIDWTDPTSCWPWANALNVSGYGVHRCGSDGIAYTTMAHRVAWILANRTEIPPRIEVDHTCWNRACINPTHLRLADRRANVRNSSRYVSGDGLVVRFGPVTVRRRKTGWQSIWREYLSNGKVRQAGHMHATEEAARAFVPSLTGQQKTPELPKI